MTRRQFQLLAASWLVAGAKFAKGAGHRPREPRSLPNVPLVTAGGQQMWSDVRYLADWRIQRHALTGHHRLVDPDDVRRAWGSLEACENELAQFAKTEGLHPPTGTAVVLLHGLFRTRDCMYAMGRYLARQQPDWHVLNLSYASTRGTVGDHASDLAQILDRLKDVERFHFVCHSMGNLVVRHWLHDHTDPKTGELEEKRLGRMVMLGPPNHRPSLAQALVPIDTHQIIAGSAGDQLSRGWKELEPKLAIPKFDFGIIAGGLSDGGGYNPLIPGDDDTVVGVDEARLEGACDFRVLPVIHATMMDVPTVQKLTHRFLLTGCFESPEKRNPVT
jgi:pimeloyl-ACP methyl ester carboxylesterase